MDIMENGSKIVIAFIDISRNLARTYSKNWLTAISLNFKFNFW